MQPDKIRPDAASRECANIPALARQALAPDMSRGEWLVFMAFAFAAAGVAACYAFTGY